MYNSILYNSAVLNGSAPVTISVSGDVFQFNGYGLQNANICTSKVTYSNAPDRDFSRTETPRYKGMIKNDMQWREKTITFEGYIKADTAAELEQLIDEIKLELSAEDGNLDLLLSGWSDTRRWVANLTSPEKMFDKRQNYHITVCPFRFEFLCIDPFGYDTDYTSSAQLAQTAATVTETVTNDGTAFSELKLIFIINSVSGFTSLTIQNNETGEQLQITDALSAGDVLIVDSIEKTVTLNGAAVNFDGQFITLPAGDNNIEINFSGTSIDYDVTFRHKNAFL